MKRIARSMRVFVGVVALALSVPVAAQQIQAGPPSVGPETGSLVVVGGNMQSPEIYKRFIELAGGPDAPIVMIPTAGGGEEYDTEAFVEPLKTAQGVFFFGGRQWRLVDAYAGTRTETEIGNVLERGGVIGGSSAGASIQGSFLVRGDTESNTVMMGDHQVGFGYLKNVGIDQHVLRRNRQFDLIEVVEAHPELLGIGLDENTAMVVRGDQAEIIGASYALIYDNQTTTGGRGRFYFLAPGDRFNLATREAGRPGQTLRPVEGPRKQPWGGGR